MLKPDQSLTIGFVDDDEDSRFAVERIINLAQPGIKIRSYKKISSLIFDVIEPPKNTSKGSVVEQIASACDQIEVVNDYWTIDAIVFDSVKAYLRQISKVFDIFVLDYLDLLPGRRINSFNFAYLTHLATYNLSDPTFSHGRSPVIFHSVIGESAVANRNYTNQFETTVGGYIWVYKKASARTDKNSSNTLSGAILESIKWLTTSPTPTQTSE